VEVPAMRVEVSMRTGAVRGLPATKPVARVRDQGRGANTSSPGAGPFLLLKG